MKVTDYAPRAAPFDSHLRGSDLIGVEVGTDVGSHAHALLKYCSIKKLYLVDIWDKEFYRGYCQGRLHSAGFMNKVIMIIDESRKAVNKIKTESLDFIYIDITHDYDTVKQSLYDWWPRLKRGGILGYRNYGATCPALTKAVDEFIDVHTIETNIEMGEIILHK